MPAGAAGPANAEGLRIRVSRAAANTVIAEWKPEPKYAAFPGVLNGGIIGTLLDCHCNLGRPRFTHATGGRRSSSLHGDRRLAIKLLRPTPTNDSDFSFRQKVGRVNRRRATIAGTLSAGGKVCCDLSWHVCGRERRPPSVHRGSRSHSLAARTIFGR